MITTADLKAQTRRELADLARNYGIVGWHGLKKDELIDEIKKEQRKARRKSSASTKSAPKKLSASATSTAKSSPKKPASSRSTPAAGKTPGAGKSGQVKAGSAKNGVKSRVTRQPITAQANTAQPITAQANTAQSSSPLKEKEAKPVRKPVKTAAQKADQKRLNKPMPKLPEPRIDPKTARIRAQIRRRRETMQKNRDLSTGTLVAGVAVDNGAKRSKGDLPHKDRVVLLVRDAFWLQATWEITRASVQRAQSSLAERWHTAVPTLRLLSVGEEDSNAAESVSRDIQIHGGVNNWYIDVDEPPSRFRVLVGYAIPGGEFYTLCRSNVVETPRPGECERLDEHWHDIAEDYERIYSLSGGYETDCGDLKEVFEERLRRSMPLRGEKGQTVTDPSLVRQVKLPFKVDAELIVFGKTVPSASVQIGGRPVKLQADGSFTVRMELPDKRQVLPVTAESRDGLRQRTTVVAVERNTKVMEAVELEDRL